MQAITKTSLHGPITVHALEELALAGGPADHEDAGATPGDRQAARRQRRSDVVAQVGVADGAQVVQFVDRRTGELVAQLPPETVLRLVEQLVDRARRRVG